MAGAGMSAGGSGGAGGKVDLNVKVNVMNMQDISKIGSRVDRQVKHMSNSFKGMGKQIGNVNVQVSAMDKSVNALGNQMGFVAFQWMFITGIATRALQQIKDFAVTTVREGAKGTDAIVRAVIQTRKLGDSFDQANMRAKGLTNFIMTAGRETIFTTEEVAHATKEVGKALKDVNGVIPVTTEVLKMATLEEMNLSQAAKGFIGILNNYKGEITSVAQVTKVLVGVNQMSRVSLDELFHAFEYSARTAADLNLTIEETGILLGILGDQLPPGQIGRQFARMLEDLRESTVAFNPELQRLGVNVYDANGNLRHMPTILKELKIALEFAGAQSDVFRASLEKGMRMNKVGTRALRAFVNAMGEYDEMVDILSKTDVEKLYKEYIEFSPEAQIKMLEESVKQLRLEFVGGLSPAIKEVTGLFKSGLGTFEVNSLMFEFGKIVGEHVLPVVQLLAFAMRSLMINAETFKKALDPVVKLMMIWFGVMMSLLVMGTVIMMFAVGASVIEKFAASSILALTTTASLLRVLGMVAAGAAVVVVSLLMLKMSMDEFSKGLEEMNPLLVIAGPAVTALGLALLFIINPWLALAAGIAIGIPLIIAGAKALSDWAGVRPSDDMETAFLLVMQKILQGLEWGLGEMGKGVALFFVQLTDQFITAWTELLGAVATHLATAIWESISPSLVRWGLLGEASFDAFWKGIKGRFPQLQEMEDFIKQTIEDMHATLEGIMKDLGEDMGNAWIDGVLLALGPLGTLLKYLFNIDIQKMLDERRGITDDKDQDFIGPKGETGYTQSQIQKMYKDQFAVGEAPGQVDPETMKPFTAELVAAFKQQMKMEKMNTDQLNKFIGGTIGTEAQFKERDRLKAQMADLDAPMSKEEMQRLKELEKLTTEDKTLVDEDLQRLFHEWDKKSDQWLETQGKGLKVVSIRGSGKEDEATTGPPPEPKTAAELEKEKEKERIAQETADAGVSQGEPTPTIEPEVTLTAAQKSAAEVAALNSREAWNEYLADQFINRDPMKGHYIPGHAQLGKDVKDKFFKTMQDRGNLAKMALGASYLKQDENPYEPGVQGKAFDAGLAAEDAANKKLIADRIAAAEEIQKEKKKEVSLDETLGLGTGVDAEESTKGKFNPPDWDKDYDFGSVDDLAAGLELSAQGLNEMGENIYVMNEGFELNAMGMTGFTDQLLPMGDALKKQLGQLFTSTAVMKVLNKEEKTLTAGVMRHTADEAVMDTTLIEAIKRVKENIFATMKLTGIEYLDIFWLDKQIKAIGKNIEAETGLTGITHKLWALVSQGEIPSVLDLIKKNIIAQDAIGNVTKNFDVLSGALSATAFRLSKLRLKVSLKVNKRGDVTGASATVLMPGYTGPNALPTPTSIAMQGKTLEEMTADAAAAVSAQNTVGVQNNWVQGVGETIQGVVNKVGDAWKDTVTMFGTGEGWFGEATPGFEKSDKRGTNVFGTGQNAWNPIQALANLGDFIKDPIASIEKAFVPLNQSNDNILQEISEALKDAGTPIDTVNVNMNIEKLDPTTDIEAITEKVVDELMENIKKRA